MAKNKDYIKVIDYILYQIYTNKWNPGEKILTSQQLVNRLGVDLQIIKKCLAKFENKKILISKERVGYFVNSDLYLIYPLSIRHKYNLEIGKTKVFDDIDKKHINIVKKYINSDGEVKVVVTSSCNRIFFKKVPYNPSKTFMANLAENNIIIWRVKSNLFWEDPNIIQEKREFYISDKILLASETIKIDSSIWNQEVDLML